MVLSLKYCSFLLVRDDKNLSYILLTSFSMTTSLFDFLLFSRALISHMESNYSGNLSVHQKQIFLENLVCDNNNGK